MEDFTTEEIKEKQPLPSFLKESPYNQFPSYWDIKLLRGAENKPLFFLIRKKGFKNTIRVSVFRSTKKWELGIAWGAKLEKTYDNPKSEIPFGDDASFLETIEKFFDYSPNNNEYIFKNEEHHDYFS